MRLQPSRLLVQVSHLLAHFSNLLAQGCHLGRIVCCGCWCTGTLEKDSVALAAVWCLRKHFALVTLAPVTMRMLVRLQDRRRGLLWHLRFEFEFGKKISAHAAWGGVRGCRPCQSIMIRTFSGVCTTRKKCPTGYEYAVLTIRVTDTVDSLNSCQLRPVGSWVRAQPAPL